MSVRTVYVYVDKINVEFPGFSIIIRNILQYIPNSRLVLDFNNIEKEDIIMPIGVVASYNLLKAGRESSISFLMDAPTLCFKSIINFYIRNRWVFNYDIVLQLGRLVKYIPIERQIIKHYKNIIVVSDFDRQYLMNRYKCPHIYTVKNGVDIPALLPNVIKEFKPTLGFLYYWGVKNSLDDIDWFIKHYVKSIRTEFPKLEIVAAGRGATNEVLSYFEKNNINYIGEVKSLNEFFSTIDIYITTVRKESGILNKALDAMAHKKLVVAYKRNMHAFRDLKDGFYCYSNKRELIGILREIYENPETISTYTKTAFKYISIEHNWEANMKSLNQIISNIES